MKLATVRPLLADMPPPLAAVPPIDDDGVAAPAPRRAMLPSGGLLALSGRRRNK